MTSTTSSRAEDKDKQQEVVLPSQHGPAPAPDPDRAFSDDCEALQKKYHHNVIWLGIINFLSGLLIFVFHLINIEALVSMGLSAGLTVYVYNATESDAAFDGGVMSWTLLTFAVVTPLSASIGMAFNRRELALKYFKTFQSTLVQLYLAHATWDWPKRREPESGRMSSSSAVDWEKYADSILDDMLSLIDELRMYLLLPTSTRARHRVLPNGMKEAREIEEVSSRIHTSMIARMGKFSKQCEFLKLQGLPGNEASRIRQWEQFIIDAIEGLRLVKSYRTPQALRSYSRILSVIVPPFFCPYYADLARSTGSLGLGIFYAILTALALTGLFECITQLEDPFFGHASLDGVNVEKELGPSVRDNLLALRRQNFPDAPPFQAQAKHAFSYSMANEPGIDLVGLGMK
mmetsp:Transcript_25544/g.55280  ORF Transcript_25544/g.55280 Transcript_25544/m.55280 type:complete len:403 (-) Transcript_25544:37-1245(-)